MPYTRPYYTYIPNDLYFNGSRIQVSPNLQSQRSGARVQGWRKLIKASSPAVSAYSSDRYRVVKAHPMSIIHTYDLFTSPGTKIASFGNAYQGWTLNFNNYGASLLTHDVDPSTNDEAQALSRVYSKIRQEAYGANGLLFLGELRETIHLLRHPLDSIHSHMGKYLDTLKITRKQVKSSVKKKRKESEQKFRNRLAKAVKDSMAGSWLEFQFGVLPLIHDVKDIAQSAIDVITERPEKSRAIGTSTVTTAKREIVRSTGQYALCLNMSRIAVSESEASVRYVAGLLKKLTAPSHGLQAFVDRAGFQLQNFVPTVWELVPWSFLIDYFTNAGEVLEAATTDTSSVFYVTKTVRHKTTAQIWEGASVYNELNYPGYHNSKISGKTESLRVFEHISIVRTLPGSLPIPPLVFSVPGIDSTKWWNMSALLLQMKNYRFR